VRTVYLGTSAFAAGVLRHLERGPHRPTLVVTRPDRPRGRGRAVGAPPVAEAARELGLAVIQPEAVNDPQTLERIRLEEPGAVCVCAYGALLKEPLLSAFLLLNVHPSLLPRWRGAAPIERAIDAGDVETGVTIMRPVPELDAGPICLQAPEPIRADDDYGALAARLEVLSADLLQAALDSPPECRPQPAEGMTYAPKVTAADRRLEPALGPQALERRVRALRPHIGAWLGLPDGERLGVRRARVADAGAAAQPGALADVGGRLVLGCAGGALELEEVLPPGGRIMSGAAYLRGNAARLARSG
jgi:methionyl-tRNA formyltransferase